MKDRESSALSKISRRIFPKFGRSPERRNIRSGYLYIFCIQEGIYKLGRTNDLIGRRYNHQVRFGGELIFCEMVNDSVACESKMLSLARSVASISLTKAAQKQFASREVFHIDPPMVIWLSIEMRRMRCQETDNVGEGILRGFFREMHKGYIQKFAFCGRRYCFPTSEHKELSLAVACSFLGNH